jgi:lysylphosphatidylglycerol synthetase-like protein (DUF2156 family)/UDP-2,3-diacylglucosamine pyrophosphatase LpxH
MISTELTGWVPDVVETHVPLGTRVVVASDLHLPAGPTPTSLAAVDDLAGRLLDGEAPTTLVLAGDCFEMLGPQATTVTAALAAHPRLGQALESLDGRVVVVPGNHDARLAWDASAVDELRAVGAEVALAADVVCETGEGPARVRVEHGHRLDPANAFGDPRNPAETPLGHHVVADLLPALDTMRLDWLDGLAHLADVGDTAAFVGARLFYRRLVRHAGWLLAPFVLLALAHVPLLARFGHASNWSERLALAGFVVAGDVALVAAGLAVAARRTWTALAEIDFGRRGRVQNDLARAEAGRLVAAGYAGLITGHTHHAELTDLGVGATGQSGQAFYANAGCGTEVVERRRARFGFPAVFRPVRVAGWVELDAGPVLRVRLYQSRGDLPAAGASRLERTVAFPAPVSPARPEVVASLPDGSNWPLLRDGGPARQRIRRRAAAALAAVGLVNLVSALTPPLRARLDGVRAVLPLGVPHAAAQLVALSGLSLLLLAGGLRRGQRRAWRIAVGLLAASAAGHIAKGLDLEEANLALGLAGYLVLHRRSFPARSQPVSIPTALLAAGAGALLAAAVPHRADAPLGAVLHVAAVGLAAGAGWLFFRPVEGRRMPEGGLERARAIVRAYGGDTLAYFALRDEKRHFFWGNSVVAYGVHHGVCLVSPDPIGPTAERQGIWAAFRAFAEASGWSVAVLGASADWLPVYRASRLRPVYMGDEAVVDVTGFTLEGSQAKPLRQAANRVRRAGYHVEFFDPARLPALLVEQLRDLMTETRQGDSERGFSMTLGRVFDPGDEGLLLAVAFDADGSPAAFCHYVPAPAIGGFSLDLMRRRRDLQPNGVTDFVVIETILHLQRLGCSGLALNFATMRAVLAGEAGDNVVVRIEHWLLRRMSDDMQIESLWRYNAKYDPQWRPRYAVYESIEHLPAAAFAVARAEGVTELPLIGRFCAPSTAEAVPAAS